MKKEKRVSFIIIFLALVLLIGCNRNSQEAHDNEQVVEDQQAQGEADLLLHYLFESGDYVNSRLFPSMIKPETVFENLGSNMHIIDLRLADTFDKGHIEGAVNVGFQDIPEYFEGEIMPYQFEKIVLVCDHGQMSGYTTCLLRLMGYGNVYSMRWGMTVWNPDLAKERGWDSLISDKFTTDLEMENHDKPFQDQFPELITGKTAGEEIFNARIQHLFKSGLRGVWTMANQAFESSNDFFIVNYDRRDKYESGHVPGAIRYKPGGTLGIEAEMKTLPTDKEIVVYCGTGHNSAFVTAYLRLFGYNAHSMPYGNNSFMHDKMLAERETLSWQGFTPTFIKDYPYKKN